MLIAETTGFFKAHYNIVDNGDLRGVLRMSAWREKAEIELGGKHYLFVRDGAVKGAFLLLEVNNVLAYATKPSAFRTRFVLVFEGSELVLRKSKFWRSEFHLERGGEFLGEIRRMGIFSRKTVIDLPDDLPLIVKVFIFWLVTIIWRRESAAAASGG